MDELTRLVRTAHADAWEAQGLLRERLGGGAARVRGARLMASGMAQAKWNNADVVAADVDLDAVQAWYAERDVPWGLRVPLELDVDLGQPLFVKRCVALLARPLSANRRVTRANDPDDFARRDAGDFGGDLDESRAWVTPEFGAAGFAHWLADGGIATSILTRGDAGPAAYITGLAARDARTLTALVETAAAEAFAAGAAFVHANPDDEQAAVLAELGAVEVSGFLVRVVRDG